MAHIYAGILGPLALLISLVRGVMDGRGTESVLPTAWYSLLVFSAVGCVIGWVAEWIVENSVRSKILAQLAADEQAEASQPASSQTAGA